jgi:tRNA-splicing ligase RtcB
MKWTNTKNRIPILSWCEHIEPEAAAQADNLANHPATFHHVALMPDCHSGFGMPIGGVIACDDAVIPNAVGVDIGCGMCAIRTTHPATDLDADRIKKIIGTLRKTIPVGFDHHAHSQPWEGFENPPDSKIVREELDSARKQLGTLGGGNHFIEIQAGSDGNVWLMIHSGSRNFGYKIARGYNAVAESICEKYHSCKVPLKGGNGLAYLPADIKKAREYIESMQFALAFARENRRQMMNNFKRAASEILDCDFDREINIHHNFAAFEEHFGRKVWVHRKGATQAEKGQMGIIPGSMGTASYIVKGLGNPQSFRSCSHGAGRLMSRGEFNRTHTIEECDTAMQGIVYGRWSKERKGGFDLSEAPQAYKDIDVVMADQSDLVEIAVALKPLGVMKG